MGDYDVRCFGLEGHCQLVPLWCVVFFLMLVTLALGRLWSSHGLRQLAHALTMLRISLGFGKADVVCEMEAQSLISCESGESCSGLKINVKQILRALDAMGLTHGIEAACLAVLLVLRQRTSYGNASVVVQERVDASRKQVEVELTLPTMAFSDLLKATDRALQKPVAAPASSDIEFEFLWDRKPIDTKSFAVIPDTEDASIIIESSCAIDVQSFQICFEACAQDLEGDVWQLPLCPASALAREQSLGVARMTFDAYRATESSGLLPVPQLLLRSVPGRGAAEAIVGSGFRLTYSELWGQAAAVADRASQIVGTEQSPHAAMLMGRGAAIGPAFVGLLCAGFQVVPIDLHWPAERMRMVLADAAPSLVLVDPISLPSWEVLGLTEVPMLCLDKKFFSAPCQAMCVADLSESTPAVLLFTSGSTGRPKGIMLSHGYLTALVATVADTKAVNQHTRTLCYHSPSWMPFIDYLFCPLLKGGACLLVPEGPTHAVSAAELRAFAQEHGATSAGFVPAVLDAFTARGFPADLAHVGCGGAPVPAELCIRALAAFRNGAGSVLYTGYSGTEQGDVTQVQMRAEEDVQRSVGSKGNMTGGRPHGGQNLVLLDQGLQLVGGGAVAEVCVSGPGLASGYLKLPERTAETFVSCSALGGARICRTGDLAVWTAEGSLEVVGRRDSMVKVRGARIEIGEVEAVIASHPSVRSCAVAVHDDRLVAYVVPGVPADLREHCRSRLAGYMVPHVFEGQEVLPLLPNGKVNRRALKPPSAAVTGAETVMELDSLGQMRKFSRQTASEDRILDNARAILIGVVIQSHATPLIQHGCQMLHNHPARALSGEWSPAACFLLSRSRAGGWSSLAFLSGFDDTRSMDPYGLTYREPLFLLLWLLTGLNWSAWYLPAFVYMRVALCMAKRAGLERVHLLAASQIWLCMPTFVDLYTGFLPWDEWFKPVRPDMPGRCPSQCFCPFEAWPWAQPLAFITVGWWESDVSHSFLGQGLIFIPCYWLGFYAGPMVFPYLTRLADEQRYSLRFLVAGGVLAAYLLLYNVGLEATAAYDDRCGTFWSQGTFAWQQIPWNLVYWLVNVSQSMLYVVFIVAAVPVHLKYLAKVCFPALILSSHTMCLLDLPAMILHLRELLGQSSSTLFEVPWLVMVPFTYELLVGAAFTVTAAAVVPRGQRLLQAWREGLYRTS